MPANWRPCLIPHRHSYCQQARTVSRSRMFAVMALQAPIQWLIPTWMLTMQAMGLIWCWYVIQEDHCWHEVYMALRGQTSHFNGADMMLVCHTGGPLLIWGVHGAEGQTLQFNGADMMLVWYFDGLVQERHNSSALAMELHLFCTNPSICLMHCGICEMGLLDRQEQTWMKFESNYTDFHSRKCVTKLQPFCSGFNVLNEKPRNIGVL